jgi:hypothetical protein
MQMYVFVCFRDSLDYIYPNKLLSNVSQKILYNELTFDLSFI